MNIQNIAALAEQLQILGFGNLGYSLMNRICFKPEHFSISQKITRGKDRLNFHFRFEKSIKKDGYILVYYDAILQKEIVIRNITIDGINTTILDESMAGIDWNNTFQPDDKNHWNAKDEKTWEKEQIIEKIVDDLMFLEKKQEGKEIAISLIYKYWADIPYQEILGPISPLKSKSEITQRFYFLEGSGISVDEAYRFLQNKWLEKQLQAKKKHSEDTNDEDGRDGNEASSSTALLSKKRLESSHKMKRSNSGK